MMNKKTMYMVVVAIIIVGVAVLYYANLSARGPGVNTSYYVDRPVPQSVVSELNISSGVSNRIGIGATQGAPTTVNAPPLMNGTKPEVLYIGAEYCPYCAITRWAVIIALSRFGSFSNLHYMVSNISDGDTPTFTFYNSTYSSNYISFVSVETTTRSRYQNLQSPTSSQNQIFEAFDSDGSIPFIDFANRSVQVGASIEPQILQGYNWSTIITNLTVANSSISQSIVGNADVFTAEICRTTNFTPSSVCSQPYVNEVLKDLG